MGCACNKGRSSRAARQPGGEPVGNSAYVWEVTYNNGDTQSFGTESEAMAALSMTGGGMRMVPRDR